MKIKHTARNGNRVYRVIDILPADYSSEIDIAIAEFVKEFGLTETPKIHLSEHGNFYENVWTVTIRTG